jgi:hypothetical protein
MFIIIGKFPCKCSNCDEILLNRSSKYIHFIKYHPKPSVIVNKTFPIKCRNCTCILVNKRKYNYHYENKLCRKHPILKSYDEVKEDMTVMNSVRRANIDFKKAIDTMDLNVSYDCMNEEIDYTYDIRT